jgi:hypothetical protein
MPKAARQHLNFVSRNPSLDRNPKKAQQRLEEESREMLRDQEKLLAEAHDRQKEKAARRAQVRRQQAARRTWR